MSHSKPILCHLISCAVSATVIIHVFIMITVDRGIIRIFNIFAIRETNYV